MRRKRKIILDTDCGVDPDDEVALMLLLSMSKKYDLEIVAITTVGFSPWFKKELVNMYIQQFRKYNDVLEDRTIPILSGCSSTMKNSFFNVFMFSDFFALPILCRLWLGMLRKKIPRLIGFQSGLMNQQTVADMHAVDGLLGLSHQYSGELEIICIGPLTNIGMAIKKDPDFLGRLKSLFIMGGLVGGCTPGFPAVQVNSQTILPRHDTNIRSDREAFATILRQYSRLQRCTAGPYPSPPGCPEVRLVSLDTTLRCYWSLQQARSALALAPIPYAQTFLGYAIWAWSWVQQLIFFSKRSQCASFLHDPLTVAESIFYGVDCNSSSTAGKYITFEKFYCEVISDQWSNDVHIKHKMNSADKEQGPMLQPRSNQDILKGKRNTEIEKCLVHISMPSCKSLSFISDIEQSFSSMK